MKKFIYVLALAVLVLTVYSFTNSSKDMYPEDLASEYVEVLKRDFVKTMDNESLYATLEANFITLFDAIDQVDAQFSESYGYYYTVIGKKDGKEKVEILKIDESDVINETYSYIDFSNLDAMTVTYCTSGPDSSPFPFVCLGPCQVRTETCLGAVCGVVVFGVCVQQ
ncbi:MAG: hypothetical protein Aureis2KO_05450 [Aureisphaera sp.]